MHHESKRSALLLIDLQVGLFNGPEKPYQGAQLLSNVNQLICKARASGAPVFAARHTGAKGSPIEVDSPFWQLHPDLELEMSSDTVFNKYQSSSFVGTGLAEKLKAMGVDQLIIAGMKTQYCIDTACRSAVEHGFQATLVADAHTCMDTPHLSAAAIIAHHNVTLQGAFAKLVDTANCYF